MTLTAQGNKKAKFLPTGITAAMILVFFFSFLILPKLATGLRGHPGLRFFLQSSPTSRIQPAGIALLTTPRLQAESNPATRPDHNNQPQSQLCVRVPIRDGTRAENSSGPKTGSYIFYRRDQPRRGHFAGTAQSPVAWMAIRTSGCTLVNSS